MCASTWRTGQQRAVEGGGGHGEMVRNTDPPALPLPPRHRCRARAPQPIAGSQSADGARERSPGRPATCRNVDRHRGGAPPPPHPPAHSAVVAAKGRDGPAGRRAWGLCPSAAPMLEPSPITGRWCRGVARAEADPLAQVGQPAGESWPARWRRLVSSLAREVIGPRRRSRCCRWIRS
jgi:hypothetical protein